MKHLRYFEAIDVIIDDVSKTYQELKSKQMRQAIVQVLIHEMDDGQHEFEISQYFNENPHKHDEFGGSHPYDIIEMKDYKKWLEEDIEIKYDDLMQKFISLEKDDKLQIWREIKVDHQWIDKLKIINELRLGKYWTYNKDCAEAHWGDTAGEYVLLHAKVDFESINWYQTMLANLRPDIGMQEQEITLNKNTSLQLLSIEVLNKLHKISGGEPVKSLSFNNQIHFKA